MNLKRLKISEAAAMLGISKMQLWRLSVKWPKVYKSRGRRYREDQVAIMRELADEAVTYEEAAELWARAQSKTVSELYEHIGA